MLSHTLGVGKDIWEIHGKSLLIVFNIYQRHSLYRLVNGGPVDRRVEHSLIDKACAVTQSIAGAHMAESHEVTRLLCQFHQ